VTRGRIVTIVAAAAALGIGLYLSWLRSRGQTAPCLAGSHGCEIVAHSRYAKLAGVPVSTLGAIGAASVLVLAFFEAPAARAAGATIAFVGAAFSLYLTWVELDVLDAVCQWCVASLVCWLVLAGSEGMRLRQVAYAT
jgi:uncharacterized membrane protein